MISPSCRLQLEQPSERQPATRSDMSAEKLFMGSCGDKSSWCFLGLESTESVALKTVNLL